MPQVDLRIVKARAKILRAEGEEARNAHFAAQIGKRAKVLVEREGFGRTEHFAPLRFEGIATAGAIVPVAVTGVIEDELAGEIAR